MKPLPKLCLRSVAVLAVAAVSISFNARALEAREVRDRAQKVLAPLPDRMPGAEHDTPELVDLGRTLFFDVRLSANNKQSCNSCHAVDHGRGGVDNEPTSPGAYGKRGGRNSPTALNAGFHVAQFWDGRADDLKAQAKGPILNPGEMAMPDEKAVLEKISAIREYRKAFAKAYRGQAQSITYDNLAGAIAAFERTLITRDRFDDFLKGDDRALSAAEQHGLDTFLSVGCTTCHNGPVLGGNQFQKVGLVNPYPTADVGRFAVTKEDEDKQRFKVPSLRNIAITAPYFHDGTQGTLADAVRKMGWHQLGRELTDDEVGSLVTFLNSLTDKQRASKKTATLSSGGSAAGSP